MDNQIRELSKRYRRRRALKRAVSLLCVVVLLFTMNTLKRNADTLERIPMCGLSEHTHTASCYNAAGEQICGMQVHVHTDACYQQRPTANGADDLGISIDGLVDAGDLVEADQAQSLDLSEDLDQGDLLDSVQGSGSKDSSNVVAVSDNGLLADDSFANDLAEINVTDDTATQKQDDVVELGNEPVVEDKQERPAENAQDAPIELGDETQAEKKQEQPAEKTQEEPINKEEKEQPVEKEEQSAEDAQEKIVEEEKGQSVEEKEEQVSEDKQEQSAEKEDEQPAEDKQEQSAEKEDEQPAEDKQEQSAEKEDEQPAEDKQEQSAEKEDEQPAEGEQEQSVEKEDEQPAEDEQEQPTEKEDEQPAEDEQEQPAEKEDEQPAEDEQEQSAEKEDEQPAEDKQEQSAEKEDEQPAEDEQEQSAEKEDEQPAEDEQEQSTEKEEEQPAEDEQEQSAEKEDEQPAEDEQEQSAEKEDEQPAEGEQEQSAEKEDEQPAEDEQEQSAEKEDEQPAEDEQEQSAEKEDEQLAEDEKEQSTEKEDEQPAEGEQEQSAENEDIPEDEAGQEAEQEAEPESEQDAEAEAEIAYPAQHFEQGTATVNIVVDAPEGAFPEGTVMVVEDVDDQKTINDIEQRVTGDFVEVTSVHAVDISFWYADTEIEPLLPISVVMGAVNSSAQAQAPVVVHVDNNGDTEVVDSETTGAAEAALEMPATADPAAQVFEADSFSVYALVMTQVIETKYIDDSGETWTIKVGYGKDANLPEGVTLNVSEVYDGDYLAEAEATLEDGKRIAKARFFDIKLMDGDREVQPDESVKVTVSLEGDAGEIEADEKQTDVGTPDVLAMHFVEANDEIVEVETRKATETEDGVTFAADGFSVWGVVYTVEFEYVGLEGTVNLDFTGFDATVSADDTAILYDTEDCNIHATLDQLGNIIRATADPEADADGQIGSDDNGVAYTSEFAEGFAFDIDAATLESARGGVSYADGELVIAADGGVVLTDGKQFLHINISGLSALKEELLEAEGVQIEVLDGNVPVGSEASYTAHTDAETQALVDAYIENESAEDEESGLAIAGIRKVAGYAAADLKITRNEEILPVEGLFQVTVDRESLVPDGMKLENLYHIHDGEVDTLDVQETEAGLVFQVTNFSDIVASYTVEFHNVDRQVIIQGGSQVLLSTLIDGLGLTREDGIVFTVDDVVRVEFATPELFAVDEVTESPVSVNGSDVEFFSEHDFRITSLRPFKEDQMTLTLTDGTQIVVKVTDATTAFTSQVKFFAQNASIITKTASTPMHIEGDLAAPTLNEYYYLLATLYDNDNNKIGWAIEPVAAPDTSTPSQVNINFSTFYKFEEDKLPGEDGYGTSKSAIIGYSSEQNRVETRLYRFNYALEGDNLCYSKAVREGSDYPEDGYEFGGNFINSEGINEIHLKQAPNNKKYFVRVRFDEEASIAFDSGDRYYVNVKVHHASDPEGNYSSFQGDLLKVDPATLRTDPVSGLRYVEFEFTDWKDASGKNTIGKFTGNEDTILVELIHQTQGDYEPKYDQNNAAPVPEGTLAKAYRVHYDTKQSNPKDTPTGFYEDRGTDYVYCYDYIDLMTINATDDYNYSTILGPNMGYGIVADHLFQGNDLQTNFAVNHYSAHGHYVSPDLSGSSSGAIVIGEFNVVDGMAENGVGEISYDSTWGRLPIGNVLNNTLIVYADDDTGYNAPDGNVDNVDGKPVVVVHADGEDLKATMVQPGIDYGIAMSNALMSHPDTFTPPIKSGATTGVVDTTGFPDGATIYVDGDILVDILDTPGGLTIKKLENQTVVFNFDTTRDLNINQFKVEQLKADGTKLFDLTTSTDTANNTEQNQKMDKVSRHIVWNLNGVKGKTTLKEVGGIFLQPNRNSEMDIAATSGGWIVSNGFVYNSSAEWHNFFADMPDTNKLNLRAIKTIDGKIPRAGQQFEFFLKEYDTTAADNWRLIETKRNTNANVNFTEMHDLSEGWHVFKIHENTSVPTGAGVEAGLYIVDQTDYYALVHVTKTTDANGDRYIITPPTYYYGPFDSGKFSATDGAQEGAFGDKVTAATFNNEAVKEGLTIEKKVIGTTDATKRFTFEIELKTSGLPLTGSYNYTVTNIAGTRTLTLDDNGKGYIVLRNGQKATIEGLVVGTTYTVTETKVGAKAITDENKDAEGYVDGYATPADSVTGEIESDIAVASFTNTYHAKGSVSLKAKKVMHNASAGNAEMELQDGQFKFTLTPLNSAAVQPQTVTNDAQGNVHFAALNFTEADMTGAIVMPNGTRVKTLIFYVTESDGELADFNYGNVTYDNNKIVLVTLTDDGAGNITATSNLDNFTVGINNTYEYKAPATLEANKKLTGRDMTDGEFGFTARLYKTNIEGEGEKAYTTQEVIYNDASDTTGRANPDYVSEVHNTPTKLTAKNEAAADNRAEPPVSNSPVTFPTVHYLDAGTYYYQITEDTGAGDLPMGVTADEPSRTYYAKVTVPSAAGRDDSSYSTVEYYSDQACTVSIGEANVLFENTQKNINFTVTKSWTDNSGSAKGEGYSIVFSVKQNGRAYPITAKHLAVESGNANQVEIQPDGTVKLTGDANGWPVVKIKNVPEGTYVVTETAQNAADGDTGDYNITYTVGDKTTTTPATVTADDSTVTIYNTQGDDKYTSITVEKKWMAGETPYTPESGKADFELWGIKTEEVQADGGATIPVMIKGPDKTVVLSSAKVGEKIIIKLTATIGDINGFFSNLGSGVRAQYRYFGNFDGNNMGGSSSSMVDVTPVAPLSGDKESYSNDTPVTVEYEIAIEDVKLDGQTAKGILVEFQNQAMNTPTLAEAKTESTTYNKTYPAQKIRDFEITADEGWEKVLSGLPLSKSTPLTTWTYYVKEVNTDSKFTVTYNPQGSSADQSGTVNGGTVVATNTKESTIVKVDKQWKFPNVDTAWPDGVTVGVKLQNNGVDVDSKTATLDAEHTSATFDDLDKEGSYTVVETGTTGFERSLIQLISGDATSGFTITNFVNDTNVTVRKTWTEEPTEDWSATFKLQKARVAKIAENGALLDTPVAVDVADNWEDVTGQDDITISKDGENPVTLSGLPVAEQEGDAVYSLKYRVVETNLTIGSSTANRIDPDTGDYLSELTQVGEAGNSYAITVNNKVDDTKTSITVNKVWQGGNPPADASVGVVIRRYKLVPDEGILNVVDNGSITGLVGGDTATVTYTVNDRPVSLGANNVNTGSYTVTRTVTVDGDKYAPATYTEEATATVTLETPGTATFTGTASFTRKTGRILINQTLAGDADSYFKADYYIKKNGVTVKSGSYTGTTGAVVEDVPTGSGYSVELVCSSTDTSAYNIDIANQSETNVTVIYGMDTPVTFSNTMVEPVNRTQAVIDIYQGNYGHATKYYDDTNYYAGDKIKVTINRPYNAPVGYTVNDESKVNLTKYTSADEAGGSPVTDTFIVTIPSDGIVYINLDDGWGQATVSVESAVTTNTLSSARNLSLGASSLRTLGASARTLSVSATPAVTGQVSVATTNLPATSDTATTPTKDDLVPQMDGDFSRNVTLNAGNSWSDVLTRLEKEDGAGHEYVYYIASVNETGVPEGTTVAITTDGAKRVVYGNAGGTLTVTDTLPTTKITAIKTWEDNNNAANTRPTTVNFTLNVDGVAGETKSVTSDNSWTAEWTGLELYKSDGTLHTYSVTEENVSAYELTGTTYANGTFTLTNKLTEEPKGSLTVTKAVTVDGDPTTTKLADGDYSFTITGPNGYSYIGTITVENGVAKNTISLTDLTPGEYTVTEATPTNGTAISMINNAETTSYNTTVTVEADKTTEVAYTNNISTTYFNVLKRWMGEGGNSVWKAGLDYGTIYYKLYRTYNGTTVQVNEKGEPYDGKLTLDYSDTTWVPTAKLDNQNEGASKDNLAAVQAANLTKETINGVEGYYIHYMKHLTGLPDGTYTAVECTSGGDELRHSAGNAPSDQYWQCSEFLDEYYVDAFKNNVEDIEAVKVWDDPSVGGPFIHPAVTFKLYRTEIELDKNETNDSLKTKVDAAKKLGGDPKKAEIFDSNGDLLPGYEYMGAKGGIYADKTISAQSSTTTVTWKDLPSIDLTNGKRYVYIVVEDTSNIPAYEYGGVDVATNTWTFTNKLNPFNLYVHKNWYQEADGTGLTEAQKKQEVTYKLYRIGYSDPQRTEVVIEATDITPAGNGTIAVDKTDVITGLPRLAVRAVTENGVTTYSTVYYGYYVEETTVGAFTVSYKIEDDNDHPAATNLPSSKPTDAMVNVDLTETNGQLKGALGTEIHNTYEKVDIPVAKIWGADTTVGSSVVVKLYTTDGTTDTEVTANYLGQATNYELTLQANDDPTLNWKGTFANLPKYDANHQPIRYKVVETKVTVGETIIEGDAIAAKYGSATVATISSTDVTGAGVTITNNEHVAEIKIVKVDKADATKTLSGAVFKLVQVLPAGGTSQVGALITVNDEGEATISKLAAGDYCLTEVTAPTGYVITLQAITFTVENDGTVTYNAEAVGNKLNADQNLVTYNSTDTTFTIGNEKGVALPATGGVGTGVVYGAGLALILLAVLGLILRKRARDGI